MNTEGSYGPAWAQGCQRKCSRESATWKVRLCVSRENCIISTKVKTEKGKRNRSSDREAQRR